MTVFLKFLGVTVTPVTSTPYSDLNGSEWYAPYVTAGQGLLPTVTNFDGSVPFRAEAPITREDTAYAIVTALGYAKDTEIADQSVLNMFSDSNSISSICKPYVSVAVDKKMVSGYDDGTFGGQNPLSRAEFAAMLDRASYIGFGGSGAWTPGTTPGGSLNPQPGVTAQPSVPSAGTGTITGSVVRASNNTHVAGATVTIGGVSAVTDIEGTYRITVPVGTYTAYATADGFLPGMATAEAVANQFTPAETIKLVSDDVIGDGEISGSVLDAETGSGIAGASIKFSNESLNQTATTDSNGKYSITLPVGNYSAEASCDGYISISKTVVSQNPAVLAQDFTLTKILPEGQVRFVLTWGETPADLDSHMSGPIDNSSSRFHVYFADKESYTDGILMANLDVDDVTSYGPETVTINNKAAGKYRYSVHDYTNRSNGYSKELSNSEAKVEVYIGNTLMKTYRIGQNIEGNLWTVCEFDGTNFTDINVLSRCEGISSFGIALMPNLSASPSAAETDEQVIYGSLIEK